MEGERGGTQARQAQAEQQGQMQPQDRQVPGEEATGRSAWLVGRDALFPDCGGKPLKAFQ